MKRPECLLADSQGTLVQRLGLLIFSLITVEYCQIVETASDIGM
jgi:hypothetical protein